MCIYIYIHTYVSKFLYLQTASHSSRSFLKETFPNLSRTPFIFRGDLMLKYVAKSFAQKMLSRTWKKKQKTFAGSHVGTLAAFVGQSLHGPLDRQSYRLYVRGQRSRESLAHIAGFGSCFWCSMT